MVIIVILYVLYNTIEEQFPISMSLQNLHSTCYFRDLSDVVIGFGDQVPESLPMHLLQEKNVGRVVAEDRHPGLP